MPNSPSEMKNHVYRMIRDAGDGHNHVLASLIVDYMIDATRPAQMAAIKDQQKTLVMGGKPFTAAQGSSPVPPAPLVPYEGWRIIVDQAGVAHHVPDHDLLNAMSDAYYGRLVAKDQPVELPPLGAYKDAQAIADEIMDIFANNPAPYASVISCIAKALPKREPVQPVQATGVRPCPFCGDDDILPCLDEETGLWECGCDGCDIHARGGLEEWAIVIWNTRAPEREIVVGDLLDFCTHQDENEKIKFDTDFVPQVIAEYELALRRNLEGQIAGAVYNAMESALDKFILQPILIRLERQRQQSGGAEVCHQLREAISHLLHTKQFNKNDVVIREMEAAIDSYNARKP